MVGLHANISLVVKIQHQRLKLDQNLLVRIILDFNIDRIKMTYLVSKTVKKLKTILNAK